MAVTQNTIEILLELKAKGQEVLKQIASGLQSLVAPTKQTGAALDQMGSSAQGAGSHAAKGVAGLRKELSLGQATAKAFGAAASLALEGVAVAAELAWGAITQGLSLLWGAFRSVLGLFNPFTIKGLVVNSALALTAKEFIDAAGAAEQYQRRLSNLIGDPGATQRVLNLTEALAVETGMADEKLKEAFISLTERNVAEPEKALRVLARAAQESAQDINDLTYALVNADEGGSRALRRAGVEVHKYGDTWEVVSGSIKKQIAATEAAVQQGVIDVLAQKFPQALDQSQELFVTKLGRFKQIIDSYMQDIGGLVLPWLKKLLDQVNDFLLANKDLVVGILGGIPQLAQTIWTFLTEFLSSGRVMSLLKMPLLALNELVLTFAEGLVRTLVAVLKASFPFISLAVQELLARIEALVDVFARNLFPRLVNAFLDGMTRALERLGAMGDKAFEALAKPLDWFGRGIGIGPFPREFLLPANVANATPGLLMRSVPRLPTEDLATVAAEATRTYEQKVNGLIDDFVKTLPAAIGKVRDELRKMADDATIDFGHLEAAIKQSLGEVPISEAGKTAQAYNQLLDQMDPGKLIPRMHVENVVDVLKKQITDLEAAAKAARLGEPTNAPLPNSYAQQGAALDRIRELQAATHALGSTTAQTLADIDRAFNKELAGWQAMLNSGAITPDAYNKLLGLLLAQRNNQIQDAYGKQRAFEDEFQVAISHNRQRALAESQQTYDREVEAWRQKLIVEQNDYERFMQVVAELQYERQQREIALAGSFADGWNKATQDAIASQNSMAQDAAEIHDKLKQVWSDRSTDAFMGIIEGTKKVSQAFKEMFSSILRDMGEFLIHKAMERFFDMFLSPLLGGFFGGIGAIFGGAAGGGAAASASLAGGVHGLNAGGLVPGAGPDVDAVPALLTPGEFVVRRAAVRQPGVLDMLSNLNGGLAQLAARPGLAAASIQRHYNAGGLVSAGGSGGGSSTTVLPVVAANDSTMETLLRGGDGALMRWMLAHGFRQGGA